MVYKNADQRGRNVRIIPQNPNGFTIIILLQYTRIYLLTPAIEISCRLAGGGGGGGGGLVIPSEIYTHKYHESTGTKV